MDVRVDQAGEFKHRSRQKKRAAVGSLNKWGRKC